MRKVQPRPYEYYPPEAEPIGITQLSFRLRLPCGLSALCEGGLDQRRGFRPDISLDSVLRRIDRQARLNAKWDRYERKRNV